MCTNNQSRKRKIRFINPKSALSTITMPEVIQNMTFSRKGLFAPTGLMICAAVMPSHWDVELVDECVDDADHTPTADVDVVGISVMTTQAPRAYLLADQYRKLGVTVVLGGIHPSALPDEALQHCDAVCRGDAESSLPHFIADWEMVKNDDNGRDVEAKHLYDWADYPSAPIATPRKDVIDASKYLVANPIQTTRGCPHGCNFCTTPAIFGRKFRLRDVGAIVEEIRAAKEVNKSMCYIFADDNFGGNHKWALELCEALKPLNIKWASQCDILISDNDKLLKAMRDSGCQGVILGLESPRQVTLSVAGKRFAKSQSYETRIRKILAARISLWGSFIFGFDTDTWQDCMNTCRFAQRTDLSMSCYPILTPYPGTAFFEQYEKEGRIRTRNWEKYNGASVVFEPKLMTAKELRHAQMAAFAEFYSLRSSVRRLKAWPIKKISWIANLGAWKGIRFYYAKKGRQVPQFVDFRDREARAWNYDDEPWTISRTATGNADRLTAEAVMGTLVAASDPMIQAADRLAQATDNVDA